MLEAQAIPGELWEGWAHRIAATAQCKGALEWWQAEQQNYSKSFRDFVNEEAPQITTNQLIFGLENEA